VAHRVAVVVTTIADTPVSPANLAGKQGLTQPEIWFWVPHICPILADVGA
jgi:hypothetical protein